MNAQTFTTVVNFAGPNGAVPESALIRGADGNLYGTTSLGGGGLNVGTVFRVTLLGALTTLHAFDVTTGGSMPMASLIQATDGSFYGTTYGGTIFRITPTGTLTTLHTFTGSDGDRANALVQGADGFFYGTTSGGGTNGQGTVFRLASNGTLTTLHNFSFADGSTPLAPLIQGSDGNFYGTTSTGGSHQGEPYGTIFKITPQGTLTTLYTFGNTLTLAGTPADGGMPIAGLIQGTDGTFYGTTSRYGGNNGNGTVFSITTAGSLATVHVFTGADGVDPGRALIQGSDGNLYGTTIGTGNPTVFALSLGGTLTTLHSFGLTDGAPSGLVQGTDGNFYGTTDSGGANGEGTVFRLALASSSTPVVNPSGIVPVYSTSTAIEPGSWISIFGRNLASGTATWTGNFPTSLGGTSVTINGKVAFLWYVSPTQINLQTPDDTARGSVQVVVTTAAGTANSAVTLADYAPSFSLLDGTHVAGIILRSDGSGAFGGGTYDVVGPTGTSLGYKTVAAKAGDTLELFGVGFGPTNPVVTAGQPFTGAAPTQSPVSLTINNVSVTPSFAGETSGGLYQLNLTLPAGLGSGDVALRATAGGVQTQAGVVLSVQ